MGNLLCSGLCTPAFLLFMFIFVSSLKHHSKKHHVIYIVLYICFYIHYIITQATCEFRWGNLDLQMFGHLLKVTQLGSDIQSWKDSALRFLTQAHGSPTTLLSYWKRSEIQINHFLPLGKLLKVFGGEGVEMNSLSEVFPSHLWFPWLMIGNSSGSPCFSWTPLPAPPLVAT